DYRAGPRQIVDNFSDIGVKGRRTGFTMKDNIKKDADGLDNIDDFWDDDGNDDDGSNQAGYGASDQDEYDDDEQELSPLSRAPPGRQYFEQELPQELLSTPTSRRSRNVPMSKGSASSLAGSIRGLSLLPGSNMYDNADEYQSPSFHAVKKRLIFTNNAELDDQDSTQDQDEERVELYRSRPATTSRKPFPSASQKSITTSPALDKLLTASREKNAQIKAAKLSPLKPFTTTSQLLSRSAPGTSATGSAKSTVASSRSTAKANAPRRPKAFDFGSGFGGDYMDDEPDEETQPYEPRAAIPTAKRPATKGITTTTTARTAVVNHARQDFSDAEEEEEDHVYHDHEPQDDTDDRLQFSDEDDGLSYRRRIAEEEEEEREEQRRRTVGQQRKGKNNAVQQRQQSQPKPKGRSKKNAAAEIIPLKKATAATTKRVGRPTRESPSAEESNEDDDSQVPSAAIRTKLNRPRSYDSESTTTKSSKRKAPATSANAGLDIRRRQDPVELVEVPVVPDLEPDTSGVRRSHRTKIAPLEFWKNERVILGKDDPDSAPVIKAVLRAEQIVDTKPRKRRRGPNKAQVPQQKQRRKPGRPPRSQTQPQDGENSGEDAARDYQLEDTEDELEADEMLARDRRTLKGAKIAEEEASKKAEVLEFGTDNIVSRVIAESRDSIQFREVEGGQYQFHRGVEDADFLTSGTIKLLPNGSKPLSRHQTNSSFSMAFYVIRGLVQVTINKTDFVVSTGGRFLVPRGNVYGVKNLSQSESLLFFVQAKTKDDRTGIATGIATSNVRTAAKAVEERRDQEESADQLGRQPDPGQQSTTTAPATPRRRRLSQKKSGVEA
ncbi:hypothetical protein BGZ98_001108, partial [Dissophora globulifera]